jgi:acyl-CoA synthetase (AMP-forming)/AMP-acid ligase II
VDPDNTSELWRDPTTGFARRTLPDEPGEMLFNIDANNVKAGFQGYTNDEKATKSKVVFDVFKKGDAWVRSGDLLRRDKNHMYYFVDRLGDTFRWKSENVSTNEVEEVVSSFGSIPQVVVVGVQVPNHEGRAGFAIVESKAEKVDLEKLANHLLSKLPRYAVPIFVKFVDGISRTGNNKVQKALYRKQKIPGDGGEVIYWLRGNKYVPLTKEDWTTVEAGKHRL